MNAGRLRGLIRVDLSIDQPWGIGGVAGYGKFADHPEDRVDLPLLTDPRSGEPQVPASSLVGALKEHLRNPERWLGRASDPSDPFGRTEPSAVRALGVTVHDSPEVSTRQSTAIDPIRRAADGGMLRVEELVGQPGGRTALTWWLQIERDDDVREIDDLAGQLISWQPVIGRRRSVGRGQATVDQVMRATIDLGTEAGMTWWLAERHPWLDGDKQAAAPPGWAPPSNPKPADDETKVRAEFVRDFVTVDPLHIGDGEFDQPDPGAKGKVARTRTFIPGSSWRGIFRHRIAHIQAMRGVSDDEIAQTRARLFGSGRARGASASAGHRGQLRFFDSPTSAVASDLMVFTHVAIDRITGGARQFSEVIDEELGEGALYKVRAIRPGVAISLRIAADGRLTAEDRALLDATVRDLDDGLIGLGGLTSRGYGTIALADGSEQGPR